MNQEQFDQLLKNRLYTTRNTLSSKGEEYARGDRLSNFKKIASMTGVTPERALWQLVSKHIVALGDFINDLDNGTTQPTDRWDEKYGDVVAYMCLLEALVVERSSMVQANKCMHDIELNVNGDGKCIDCGKEVQKVDVAEDVVKMEEYYICKQCAGLIDVMGHGHCINCGRKP